MTTLPLSLEHLVRPPKNNVRNPPSIFMFHGYGSNEEDLFSFAPELPDNLCVISVRAPHPLPPYGFAWYRIDFDANFGKWSDTEQARASLQKMVRFIEEAVDAYKLDASRVSLLGFSQGTVLSLALALSYPEMIQNVIGLSGYVDESILPAGYGEKDHSHLNMYISHGQLDPVIPISWASRTPAMLESLGITYIFEEFPVGHGVSRDNFYSMNSWLTRHI